MCAELCAKHRGCTSHSYTEGSLTCHLNISGKIDLKYEREGKGLTPSTKSHLRAKVTIFNLGYKEATGKLDK